MPRFCLSLPMRCCSWTTPRRPFQTCVEKGRVSGLMCSYNAVNGVPSCANDWLQNTIARGEWQFDGYITSDCDADDDVYSAHHYTKTPEEAVRGIFIFLFFFRNGCCL